MNAPKYSLPRMRKLETKITDALHSEVSSVDKLDASILNAVVETILSKIPASKDSASGQEKREVITSLLTEHFGEDMSGEVVQRIARKVAGWQHHLKDGTLFHKWNMSKPVWACLKVIDMEPLLLKPRKYLLTFESFAGPSVNMKWKQVFTGPFIKFLIKSIGGICKEEYSPYDIFGLWLSAAVHFDKARFSLSKVHASSSQHGYNRKMLKARKGRCIGGFTEGKCFDCPYGIDKCALARRNTTLSKEICKNSSKNSGGKHRGYIQKNGYCMVCILKGEFEISSYKKKSNIKKENVYETT